MLPRAHKLTSSAEFRRVISQGGRAGTRTLVVHYYTRTETVISGGPRFGLIVSKQVGNAVARHRLSRQLRHVCMEVAEHLDREVDIVVRALPASADATSAQLLKDMESGIERARKKAAARS
ncbi:ribonuclease P protein component [Corynebacterium appendicis CIP 107643]|mgnify:CR=1 FL=1|uniref:Ribonuclease P protein component n=1 Tax=Corynebacterium appendicis CIP 107643 TaxID=1161099 RepID=A0A1N7IQF8_9CORY|nr:ribonuclease P protein component [Corynebacterium appendicis]MCT1684446.1 ribonuclease P protein component [Corynebacterium appendicis]WJY62124.1 Ribonuclease P protein component [Corynebacterium appendicis CIP 107643]SIS39310.1 ribonuclease P protein component [Corynebacterium appendicis CIP 107643]